MGRLATLAQPGTTEQPKGGRLSRLANTTPDKTRADLMSKIHSGKFDDIVTQSNIAKELVGTLEDPANTKFDMENQLMLSSLFDISTEEAKLMEPGIVKQLYGEPLEKLSNAVVNKNLKQDTSDALTEMPLNLWIGTIGLTASALEAVKRNAILLSGGGLIDDDVVRKQFEAITPPMKIGKDSFSDPRNAENFMFDLDKTDFIRANKSPFVERPRGIAFGEGEATRLPGSLAADAVGVVTRLPDVGAKLLRMKQKDLVAKQDIATMSNAPITKLTRSVVQSGVPSVGAAVGISLLTGNPLVGLTMLGEMEGGAAFEAQLQAGGSVRKSALISLLSEGAEVGGEMLVFPKIMRGFKEGLSIRKGLTLVAENATQEGITGFNQRFLEVFGIMTSEGVDPEVAAKEAFIEGYKAMPENAFVGGVIAGGTGLAGAAVTQAGKLAQAKQFKATLDSVVEQVQTDLTEQAAEAATDEAQAPPAAEQAAEPAVTPEEEVEDVETNQELKRPMAKFDKAGQFGFFDNEVAIIGGIRLPGGTTNKESGKFRFTVFDRTSGEEVDVGIADLNIRRSDKSVVGITNLEISKEHRGKGVGKQLIEKLVQITEDGLAINDVQEEAIGFWEKLGAKVVEGRKGGAKQINMFIPKDAPQPATIEQQADEEIPEIPQDKRIISKDAFDAAVARFTDQSTLRTGIDPQLLKDAATIGGYLVETGVRKFSTWSADMVNRLGDTIKPHLQDIWQGIQADKGVTAEKLATDNDLLLERRELKAIPKAKQTPQQISRITEIEDDLVERNKDEFPDIDISPKARTAEAKKVSDQIGQNEIYQAVIESAADVPDVSGVFNVDKAEYEDVKARFEGQPELLRKFSIKQQGGSRWDSAAQELGVGETLDEFMDAVEAFVDSQGITKGKVSAIALEKAVDSGEPSIMLLALKHDMLAEGFTAAEINVELQELATREGIDSETLSDDLIKLEDVTDVERKQRILRELDKTTRTKKKQKTASPQEKAISKAQARSIKENVPTFITEKNGKFTVSVNQPASGNFLLVTPAPKGKTVGKVERVTQGKEGLTKTEIKAAGPEAAARLIKKQAAGEQVGFKAGERASREKAKVEVQKIKSAQKLTAARRTVAADLVKEFVDKEDRGAFLKRIADAKTPRDLEKIALAVDKGITKAEKKSAIADLNKAAKAINPKKMLPEFASTAQSILDSIQTGKLRPDTEVKNSDLRSMAQQVIDTARPDSVAAFQAEQILTELRGKTAKTFAVNQLSVESIEQITDALTALRFQNEADTIAAKDENATEAIKRRGEVIESITTPPAVPDNLGGKGLKKFKLVHDNLESVLDATAGARPGTYQLWKDAKHATTKYIYDVINDGVDDQINHVTEARNILRGVLDDNRVTKNEILNWSMRTEDVSLVKKAFNFGPKPEVKSFTLQDAKDKATDFEFTPNELMSIYMHSRNNHNLTVLLNDGMDRIIKGDKQKIRGFTVEIIDSMIDSLTDTQRKVARQVGSKLMDGFNRDEVNKTSAKLEFFELAKVDNYWPARRSLIRTPKGQQLAGAVRTVEGMGLLKERTGTANPMRMTGFFETVYGANKNVASYVGLAGPLREVKSVWTVPVVEQMENEGRSDEAKLITDFIVRIEDQSQITQPLDTIIKRMLGGFAKSKLFLNLKIAPRQQISEFLISAYVDNKYLTAFRGLPTKQLIQEITDLSPQLGTARFEGLQFDRDVGDAFQQNELMNYLTGDTTLIDKTAVGMKIFDTNAIVDIYRAVKAEVIDNNPNVDIESTEGKALLKDRFEWVTRHTQPMWQVKDRSLLGSDPRPLVRALTMFMSQREQLIRMINNGISDYVNSDKTTQDATRLGKSLGAVAMSMTAFTLYNLAWASLIHRKEKDVKDLTKDFFKDILSLPFFGKYIASSFELIFNTITEQPTFRQDFGDGPIEGILGDILLEAIPGYVKAGKDFVTKEKYKSGPNRGDEKWKNELLVATDSLVDAVASLKGIPYYGAKDIARSAKAQITGGEDKKKKSKRFR